MGVVLTWSGSSVHSGSSLAILIMLSPGYGGRGMAAAEVYIRQQERGGCQQALWRRAQGIPLRAGPRADFCAGFS